MITDWSSITSDSINEYWSRIIDFIPNLIGAIIIVAIGLIVGMILKWAVVTILDAIKIQSFFDRIHFTELLKKAGIAFKAQEVSGQFIKWLTIVIFLIPAAKILGLEDISQLLENLLQFIPNVVVAAMILLIGTLIANLMAQVVKAGSASIGLTTSRVLGTITRYVIYIFIGIAAFFQLNVPPYLINVMFTGLVAALAISAGLAFGLGGQTAASDLFKKIREDFKK